MNVRFAEIVILSIFLAQAALTMSAEPGFEQFHERAKKGERLTVVFFGASLTWGANASDPAYTSYRARVAEKLQAAYTQAHFTFHDAAIGGTGSQLGIFRLQRDVLSRKPDLVFLDFSANDDINSAKAETLASYEALVRRILEYGAPVVQVIFPFKWNVTVENTTGMARRDAHLKISAAYNTAAGDAIELCRARVSSGATAVDTLWPHDGVHPGDTGYAAFADAAWTAYEQALAQKRVCKAPERMLYAATYMKSARVRLSSLAALPQGWRASGPGLTAAAHDMLMSRWLDDVTVASNRGAQGAQNVAPLRVRFKGSMVLLFGESTPKSCKYRVQIDGKVVERPVKGGTSPEFDAGELGVRMNGNSHHVQVIAEGLDPAAEHTLLLEPIFAAGKEQELRLESICVAGAEASVELEGK